MSTYYVDQTLGNDGNVGTSGGAPWKTLNKLNITTRSAGDTVLFKDGERWRESLAINQGGSVGLPIAYGTYGTGVAPQITGADLVGNWTHDGGDPTNVWRAACTDEPKVVILNGIPGRPRASAAACTSQYDWYWASNLLYTYAASDPDTLYTSPGVEAGKRDWGISTDYTPGLNYITLTGLCIYGVNEGPGIWTYRATNWIVTDCVVKYLGRTGIQWYGVSYSTITGCTLLGVRTMTTEWRGVYIHGDTASTPGGHNTVTLNTINNWTGYAIDAHGYNHHTYPTTGDEISYNDVSHCCAGVYYGFANGGHIHNNTCNDNLRGPYATGGTFEEYGVALSGASNVEVDHNICTNGRQGFAMWNSDEDHWPDYGRATGNRLHHNQSSGNIEHGFLWEPGATDNSSFDTNLSFGNGYAGMFVSESVETLVDGTGNTICNNTVSGNDTRAAGYADIYFGSSTEAPGFAFKNNLVYSIGELCLHTHNAAFALMHGNNLYYRASGNIVDINGTTYTMATGATWEATGIFADPKFVNASGLLNVATDFRIAADSPCVNAGALVGLSTDYDGNPYSGLPDIGAYEHLTATSTMTVILDLYASPTFTLKTRKRHLDGVVGTDVVFIVRYEAVGGFASDVVVTLLDYPAGAVVTYDPSDGVIGPGEEVEITVDTDACVEESSTMRVIGSLAV